MPKPPSISELPPPPPGKTGWPWDEAPTRLPDTMPDGTPWLQISVVTPSYNQAQFLEETIRSVLLQGYPALEYILIDGGSTDGSLDLIQKYAPWLDYWVSEADRGQSHAINKGFQRASGEILAWLNSDDIYLPNALAQLALAAVEHPEVDLIYGDCDAIDRHGSFLFECEQVKDYDQRWMLEQGNIIAQPSAFFRREAYHAVGGVDEELHYVMDWDLWLRLGQRGRVVYLPKKLACMRIYPEAKSSAGDRLLFAELKRMLGKHGGEGLTAYFETKLAWDHLPKAFEAFRQGDLAVGREEIAYILENAPDWRSQPRKLAREIADQAWKLAQTSQSNGESAFSFARQVCNSLPENASPERVYRLAQSILHAALAFQHHNQNHAALARRHALQAFFNDITRISNRGLLAVVVKSFLPRGISR